MPPRGTKPLPTKIKEINGTVPSRIAKNEPKIAPLESLPAPPEHLDEYALEEWRRISEALYTSGILTHIDTAGLAMYSQAYGRWRKAEEAIQEAAKLDAVNGGLVEITTNGNLIQSPMVGIANTSMRDAMKYAAEYGLTPSSRARLGVEIDRALSDDPLDKYFQ